MSGAGGGTRRLIRQLKWKIEAEEFYDAHQLVRAVFERFAKESDLEGAIVFAEQYAEIFAKHEQFELCVNLGTRVLSLIKQMQVQPDSSNVTKLASLFDCCPPNSTETKFEFMDSIILWVTKNSPFETELLNQLRIKIADAYFLEGKYGACQNHLVYCNDAQRLVDLVLAWQKAGYPSEEQLYVLRLMLILLHKENISLAEQFIEEYCKQGAIKLDDINCPPPIQLSYLLHAAAKSNCFELYEILGRKYVLILRLDPCIGKLYQLIELSVFKVKREDNSIMSMMTKMFSGGGMPSPAMIAG